MGGPKTGRGMGKVTARDEFVEEQQQAALRAEEQAAEEAAEQRAAKTMSQRKQFVVQAAEALYFCALQCRADKVPWPADLDEAHALLWAHLGRDEELRREMVGPAG